MPHLKRFAACVFRWFCALSVLTVCSQPAPPSGLPTSSVCDEVALTSQPAQPDTPQLEVWVRPYQQYCGRIHGPLQAAQHTLPRVSVLPRAFELGERPFSQMVTTAFAGNRAPDILFAPFSAQLIVWWQAGYLEPLNTCTQQHPEFNSTFPFIQQDAMFGDVVLGVPVAANQTVLYFNRRLLKAIGWDDDRIAKLPGRIATGEFMLDDLMRVAQHAVDSGVVARGYGLWGGLGKTLQIELLYSAFTNTVFDAATNRFVVDQTALQAAFAFQRSLFTQGLMHPGFMGQTDDNWTNIIALQDAIAHGRVLFWFESNEFLGSLEVNYLKPDPTSESMISWMGVAPIPTNHAGGRGRARWNHIGYYAVVARAKSQSRRPDAACALLAKTLLPDINARTNQRSRNTPVLHTLLTQPSPLLDTASKDLLALLADSRKNEMNHWAGPQFWPVLRVALLKAEAGQLSAAAAAQEAIQQLRAIMPDKIIATK